MTRYGIDVSRHNGSINWTIAKASGKVDFAILRAGYGKVTSQKDSRFEEYYQQCKAVGIPVGSYWYSYAMTTDEARQEAEVFLKVIAEKQFEYPVYFDLEEQKQLTLGRTKCSEIAKAFLKTDEKNHNQHGRQNVFWNTDRRINPVIVHGYIFQKEKIS